MKKPRSRKPGTGHTISSTDEEWDVVRAGAVGAGTPVSAWVVECALTVDPLPGNHRRLTLDEREQRYISRAVGEHARSLHSGGDAPSQFTDDLRALLEARLRTMARQGRGDEAVTLLRTVFGDERAEMIAAALMQDVRTTPGTKERPQEEKIEEEPERKKLPQGEFLFGSIRES